MIKNLSQKQFPVTCEKKEMSWRFEWQRSDLRVIRNTLINQNYRWEKNTPVALKHFLYEKQWNTTKHQVLVSKVIGLGKL